jgi:hypothetical protein
MTVKRIQTYGRSDPMATHLAAPAVPAEPMQLTLCGYECHDVRASIKAEVYDRYILMGEMQRETYWFPTCNECLDKLCNHCGCSYHGHADGKCLFMETSYAPTRR